MENYLRSLVGSNDKIDNKLIYDTVSVLEYFNYSLFNEKYLVNKNNDFLQISYEPIDENVVFKRFTSEFDLMAVTKYNLVRRKLFHKEYVGDVLFVLDDRLFQCYYPDTVELSRRINKQQNSVEIIMPDEQVILNEDIFYEIFEVFIYINEYKMRKNKRINEENKVFSKQKVSLY